MKENASLLEGGASEMAAHVRRLKCLMISGWAVALALGACVVGLVVAYATSGSSDGTTGYAASNGCLYTSKLVVSIAAQSEEFLKCVLWHNRYFSAYYVAYPYSPADISFLNGCYWDLTTLPLESSADWKKMVSLKADLTKVMADSSVKTTEKLRLQWVESELDLAMTLAQRGHLFSAFADPDNEAAVYLDPVIDSGRALRLLVNADHTSQSNYTAVVLNWLSGFNATLPKWEAAMRRAVAERKTHAQIVMDYQASHYTEALAVNYTRVCPTLKTTTDQAQCVVLAQSIAQGLASFKTYFEGTYVAACAENRPYNATGLWAVPDGPEVYTAWLKFHLGYTDTARRIFELGKERVEANKADILSTIQQIDSTIATYEEAAATLANSSDERWFICTNDTNEVIEFIQLKMIAIEDGLIPEFRYFPGVRIQVIVSGSPSTMSNPASYDNVRNFWKTHAYYNVGRKQWCEIGGEKYYVYDRLQASTVAHEALPGHGLQLQLASEVDCGIASPYALGTNLYTEGWGLYSEGEPYRMRTSEFGSKGLYYDPTDELSYFTNSMLRNVRMVVDTGLHGDVSPTAHYSFDDCVNEMVNNSFSLETSQAQCERYVQMPGQAVSYMLGYLKFSELRNSTQISLGSAFDAAEFHNVLLRWGAMGMELLEKLVGTYVQWKLNPNSADLEDAFGYDIIRDEMFSSTKPIVGLGRQSTKSQVESSARAARIARTLAEFAHAKEMVQSQRN